MTEVIEKLKLKTRVFETGTELSDDFLDRVVEVESNRFAEAIVVTDFREFMKIFKQKKDCEGLFVMKFRDTLIQKLGVDVFVYDLDYR